MEFKQLMSELGEKCGVGDLPVDDDGVAMLQADDILLSFVEIPATRQLVTYAVVAEWVSSTAEWICSRVSRVLRSASMKV